MTIMDGKSFIYKKNVLESFILINVCTTFQSHLLGVFENVNEVQFHEKDYDRILSVISREGEKIVVGVL